MGLDAAVRPARAKVSLARHSKIIMIPEVLNMRMLSVDPVLREPLDISG